MVNFTNHNNLVGRVSKCFNDPSVCDVTVYGPNSEVYHCLRFNLCMSSEIFKQMLSGENSKELYLHDVDSGALGHLLTFLHSGECEVTDENFIPLMSAAEMFEVPDLLEVCAAFKRKHLNINEKNCCYLLEDSMDFGATAIGDECREYITRNMDKVCSRTEFLLMDFDVVQSIGAHAEENLFRSQEEGAGHMCMWVVLGLIKWMERDLPHREILKMDLLWNLDLAPLSPDQMACICRCDIIRRSPELSMSVIDALASMCNKKVYKATYPGNRVKTFESQGTWEHWEVDASGWYTVVARNAKSDKPSCVKVYKGFNQKVENEEAAGGAGFYFHMGDEVRAMIGSGASPSCVIVKSHKSGRDQMVLVGGGDVDMALSGEEEACTTTDAAANEKTAHSMDMVPKDPLYDDYNDAYAQTSQVAASYKSPNVESTSGRYEPQWGTIGYPVNNHSSITFKPNTKGIHQSDAICLPEGLDEDRLLNEPSLKLLKQSVQTRIKSKKRFPRVDSTKVRNKWKRFVEVVKDF